MTNEEKEIIKQAIEEVREYNEGSVMSVDVSSLHRAVARLESIVALSKD